MNIISVLAFCTLLLFIQATNLNEGYYVGFIDTLGIDTHVTDDGVDCTEPASRALSQFRDAIVHGHKDTENVLQAVADIIDRLKFEVSPQCRTFYGEFLDFMDIYFGDAEEIKSIADRNLKEHNEMIEKVVNDSRNALVSGDDYGVGKGHANVLKLLLDLEKAEVVVEKTVEAAQEILEIAKEEIAKLGQTVNETVEKVVEMMAKEEDASTEEEVLIWAQDMVKKEEPVHVHEVKEQVPVQEDMKNDSASFNEQMDYEYFDIVGAAEVQHEEGEDEYEDGVVEEESLLTEDLSDKEEIGAPVDLKHYPEDDQEEEEKEEEEEEEEDYLTDDDVVKVELEEQKRQQDDQDDSTDQSTDDSTDDYDAYLSQYDDEVVEIQRRVLSQDYHYNYDL